MAGDQQFAAAERWIEECDVAARQREEIRREEERQLEEERRARERSAEIRRQEEERRMREEAEEREREERRIKEAERAERMEREEAGRRRMMEEEEERDREERRIRAERLAREEREREQSLAGFATQIDVEMDEGPAGAASPIGVDELDDDIPDQTATNPGETDPVDPEQTFGTMFGLDGRRVGPVLIGDPVKVSELGDFLDVPGC